MENAIQMGTIMDDGRLSIEEMDFEGGDVKPKWMVDDEMRYPQFQETSIHEQSTHTLTNWEKEHILFWDTL